MREMGRLRQAGAGESFGEGFRVGKEQLLAVSLCLLAGRSSLSGSAASPRLAPNQRVAKPVAPGRKGEERAPHLSIDY